VNCVKSLSQVNKDREEGFVHKPVELLRELGLDASRSRASPGNKPVETIVESDFSHDSTIHDRLNHFPSQFQEANASETATALRDEYHGGPSHLRGQSLFLETGLYQIDKTIPIGRVRVFFPSCILMPPF
jgi:hypothetical protein